MLLNGIPGRPDSSLALLSRLNERSEARVKCYQRGEAVLHSFTAQENLYIVQSGFVKAFVIENSGEVKVQAIHSPGEIFPLECLTSSVPGDSMHSEFNAMTDCKVLCISQNAMWRLLSEQMDTARILLEQVAQQCLLGVAWARNLGHQHARERLAHRLLYMGYQFGSVTLDGAIMLPEFNQMQIAETINMTRESVNRELRCLEELGIVAYLGKRICIVDLRALSQQAEIEDSTKCTADYLSIKVA